MSTEEWTMEGSWYGFLLSAEFPDSEESEPLKWLGRGDEPEESVLIFIERYREMAPYIGDKIVAERFVEVTNFQNTPMELPYEDTLPSAWASRRVPMCRRERRVREWDGRRSVSYTHLTLPTIYSV